MLSQNFPREGDFDAPALVGVGWVIECAVNVDSGLQAGNVPCIVRLALIHIRLVQEQVPTGVKRVHLEFIVSVRVAIRIDEHLEIGVLEDNGVVLRKRSPDVRFFDLGGDV